MKNGDEVLCITISSKLSGCYQSAWIASKEFEGKVYNFSSLDDINQLYLISDILITDYSSVFFDFANTRRKIILFVYDKEQYIEERGMYLDIDTFPFDQARTTEELAELINRSDGTTLEYDYNDF